MVSVGLQVRHKAFGIGEVVAVNGKYMTVRFEIGDKNFVYPDSFEKFLTLADGTVSEDILSDLSVSKDAKARIEEKKKRENIHSMTHGIVIPGKETVQESDDKGSSDDEG